MQLCCLFGRAMAVQSCLVPLCSAALPSCSATCTTVLVMPSRCRASMLSCRTVIFNPVVVPLCHRALYALRCHVPLCH